MTTAAPTTVPKPKNNLPYDILSLLIIAVCSSLIVQWLFNNTFSEVYGYPELQLKVAFVIITPLLLLSIFIKRKVDQFTRFQIEILTETTMCRMYLNYVIENTYVIATNLVDKKEKVDYNNSTEHKEPVNDKE